MTRKANRHSKMFMTLGMVLAGLCLFRSVQADDVEVYAAQEDHDEDSTRSNATDEERYEIRLTRPGEAEARIADQGYDLVPGSEHLTNGQHDTAIAVPTKTDRKIASEPASDLPIREGVAASAETAHPSSGQLTAPKSNLKAEAIEPHADVHEPRAQYGLKNEPRFETQTNPPIPTSAHRSGAGVQEISLIVSDYGYFPKRIFVTQNVPVKIYMTTPSKNTLCFMLDNWGVKKGVNPGKVDEVSFTPVDSGDFRFYCPVKSIEGMLTVREAPLAEQSTRGLAADEEKKIAEAAQEHLHANEPKNAGELRALIED